MLQRSHEWWILQKRNFPERTDYLKCSKKIKEIDIMKKTKLILFCVVVEVMLIASVALANLNPTPVLYFLFYNLMYGLVFSFLVPLYFMHKKRETLSLVGIKKMGVRQVVVLIVFAAFSIGGQLIPMIVASPQCFCYIYAKV